jgi:cyclase
LKIRYEEGIQKDMRIIAKLDVKPPYVVKPVHFEGLRKVGIPQELAKKYYDQGADEIFYIDIVASLYRRKIIFEEIEKTANDLYIPFGVGGGVKSIEDFSRLFHTGADKVIINTYAIHENPELIDEAAEIFGKQAVVVNVESKRWHDHWECYTDCGRIQSGKSVLEWVEEVEERGAGEILLQSVDHDGRGRGFDIELAKKVVESVDIPVVVASGAGSLDDIGDLARKVDPSGIAIASVLHYGRFSIAEIKKYLVDIGVEVSNGK